MALSQLGNHTPTLDYISHSYKTAHLPRGAEPRLITWYVYALKDPRDGAVCYVGKSRSPHARLLAHVSERGSRAMKRWLARLGAEPTLEILSTHESERGALAEERRVIVELSARGARLVNRKTGTCGGLSVARKRRFSGIGTRIFQTREALGIDQTRLAQRSDVAQSTISRIECGRMAMMDADAAILIARALNVSVEWLVTGEERQSNTRTA